MVDHYQTLHVSRGSSRLVIKRAYRRLAKLYHPDRNPDDPLAEERFKQINAAYEVLGDAAERLRYDQELLGYGPGESEPAPADGRGGGAGDAFEEVRRAHRTTADLSGRFSVLDALLGGLLAMSLTMAALAGADAARITAVAVVGPLVVWLWESGPAAKRVPRIRAVSRRWRDISLVVLTGLGVAASAFLMPAARQLPAGWSGWFCAAAGGVAGGLVGASLGRAVRHPDAAVAGGILATMVGAMLGGGVGGFLWYWDTVFSWTHQPWPPDETLSLLALRGVAGSVLGGGLASVVGTLRDGAAYAKTRGEHTT